MPWKPFCHTESICEHGMHGPHFVISGHYLSVVCVHFPSTSYSPMSSVVALELSKLLFSQRWVGDRPSRVKSAVHAAYNEVVRQICKQQNVLRKATLSSPIVVQNNISEGLIHILLAPALMQNSRLASECPLTCPVWCEYTTCNNQTKWADTPCNRKPRHKASQSTRSNALRIHNGLMANIFLSITRLALNKWSSILRFVLKSWCSSGWACSNSSSIHPKIRYANVL